MSDPIRAVNEGGPVELAEEGTQTTPAIPRDQATTTDIGAIDGLDDNRGFNSTTDTIGTGDDSAPYTAKRLLFIGATRNYFKVGHTTIEYLLANFPDVQIRLAIPYVENARRTIRGTRVELVEWDPDDCRSLDDVFRDCDATLLVPPIENRVQITRMFLDAAKRAGIRFLVCLGIQHDDDSRLLLARDANEVRRMLDDSGIAYCHLYLPVFLENLLYQIDSITIADRFSYPCSPRARFSYVACSDLGRVVARSLVHSIQYQQTKWTALEQTSCEELALDFTRVLGRPIRFEPISDDNFVETILNDTGCASSPRAARGVLELWHEIEADRDLPPNDEFARILGRRPMTAGEWIREHACCFRGEDSCKHPHPPPKKTG